MFKGVYTALITPFNRDGEVDYEALKKIVEFQIENNVAGVVPCGTTGESPTLTDEEQITVIQKVVQWVNKRCQVIAGTGSNNTAHAIEMSKKAQELGADACLVVNPYYNKPTQQGLYLHFKAVADAVDIPVVVYNIKGRTGVNVETDTLLRLIADCSNITSVKEASGDIEQMKEVIAKAPDNFDVLSGDDGITRELISHGGRGVISVASNLIPGKMVELVSAALDNDAKADEINSELSSFFDLEFIETNPIPIKAAVALKGMCEEVYRLPLCELSDANREKWVAYLKENSFI